MKIREIDIDFSAAKIFWAPEDPEFAQFWNGASSFLPYLEPFLNKAVREGANQLPTTESALREDCRIFIAQEGRHYRNHAKFNQFLRESGYPELAKREAVMKADYEGFWKDKGFKYCLGYAEGFETLGPIIACFFLEGARELHKPSVDDPTADLWRWHLAEEYEHRHVCNYLFHRVYPGSYWYRLYGIAYAGRHMLSYMIRTALYLLREDYKAGRIKRPWRSRWRTATMLLRLFAYITPRLIKGLGPKYDPINLPAPKRSMEVLAEAEAKWTRSSNKPVIT
ncbi:Predicted metal-dependent hydrolase [Burkholderia sp. OK233]|nr:Predicted metal-dependent hydrolase [Burkholderia sp. OK233]